MTALQLFMTWLAARPLRTRVAIYNVVLVIAVVLAVLVWALPFVGITDIGPIDFDELGEISIVTGALAALLAKANARPAVDETPRDE